MLFDRLLNKPENKIESELKRQAEEKGLDYDLVKNDADSGIRFRHLSFGNSYALIRYKKKPLLVDYSDLFWAHTEKSDDDNDLYMIFITLDNYGIILPVYNSKIANRIFESLRISDKNILLGFKDEYYSLYNRNHDELAEVKRNIRFKNNINERKSVYNNSLTSVQINSLKAKINRITELFEKLQKIDKWWYYKANTPLSRSDIEEWCSSHGAVFPEALITILTIANGFCIEYASTTGYFNITSFDTAYTTESLFSRSKEEMFERDYNSIKNCKYCFGWVNHRCLYFNPYTGEIFIENVRYKYTPVRDFENEIIDSVIQYLEKETELFSRKEKLLNENRNNPLKPEYNRLMEFAGDKDLPRMNIYLYPPVTEEEIANWETDNCIKLPEEYRNWIKLSNGGSFANKFILGLEELRKGDNEVDLIDGVEYIILAGLTGCFDYLVFNAQTGEYSVLTEDFELEESVGFEDEIFTCAFEYLEEEFEDDE